MHYKYLDRKKNCFIFGKTAERGSFTLPSMCDLISLSKGREQMFHAHNIVNETFLGWANGQSISISSDSVKNNSIAGHTPYVYVCMCCNDTQNEIDMTEIWLVSK